jgi:hypothetical protein
VGPGRRVGAGLSRGPVPALPAYLVATPVLERLTGQVRGRVLGAGATAAWADLDGFVVAVTTREVPLLPNAVALGAGAGALAGAGVAAGAAARLAPGRIDLGPIRVTWDPAAPPAWDPAVPVPVDAGPGSLARRGTALLRAIGAGPGELVDELARLGLPTATDPDGAAALELLVRAVRERDPEPAGAAALGLLGRGPGLTPEGDDLLAAVAGALAVLGPVAGWDRSVLAATLAALVAPAPARTTALSATLLGLAAGGRLAEPAGRLLDLGPGGEAAWPAALARLERLGHGSGRAYAAGIAATASLLAEPAQPAARRAASNGNRSKMNRL